MTTAAVRIARALVATTRPTPASALHADSAATLALVLHHAYTRSGWRGLLLSALLEWLDLMRSALAVRFGRPPAISPWGPNPPRPARRRSRLSTVAVDLRRGIRSLASTRLTSAIALLTLALGIGITTAAFSVLDSVVFRAMPFADAHRLVEIWNLNEKDQFASPRFARALLLEWRKQTDLFDAVEGYEIESAVWKGPAGSDMVSAAYVTPRLLSLLGVPPREGRLFADGDGRQGTDRIVIISDQFRREHLGPVPSVVGRTLTLNGEPHTIVGVMPASFRFPNGPQLLWLPLDVDQPPAARLKGRIYLTAFARIQPGVARALVDEQVRLRGAGLAAAAGSRAGISARTNEKGSFVDRKDRTSLAVLAAAVGFLLLIVCANIANLSLSRLLARARDFAVRAALGASRGDLIRETLVEHAALGVAGAALGLLVARAALALTIGSLPPAMLLSSLNEIDLDSRALLFTALAGIITAILFGLPPALIASRPAVVDVLRRDSRSATGSAGARRWRAGLVVAEVAISIVLLTGAALMGRSLIKLQSVDRGFDTGPLVAVRVGFPSTGYADPRARDRYTDELLLSFSRLPGVRSATAGSVPPDADLITFGKLVIADRPGETSDEVILPGHEAWPNYFQTVGIPLKEGRPFAESEAAGSIIVSESLARKFWPDRSAIGAQLRFTHAKEWKTVIGVAGEVRQMDLDDAHGAYEWYLPLRTPLQAAPVPPETASATETIVEYRTFVIRADDPPTVVGQARRAVHGVDPNVVIWKVDQVDHLFAEAVARPRIVLLLMSVLATLGLVLAAAGIYGVLSYLVTQRRREIGIRLALGARPQTIGRLILRNGLGLTTAGLMMGLAAAWGLVRVMRTLLYEVEPSDPASMAMVTVVLLAAAAVASWWPARRAMRVDPASLLREE
jgi:predicted permease